MKVCYLSYPLDLSKKYDPSSVAMGYFDGVHLGHQKVVETAIHHAKNKKLASGVMTFHPHPREVLGKSGYSSYLTPLEDKLQILERMGVDIAYVVQFSPALSRVQPQDFIENFLIPLKIKHVVAGFDYKFGSKGTGTPEYMKQWSRGRFEVYIINPIKRYDAKVGSTLIREYVKQGNVSVVNELLGRPYYIEGESIGLAQDKRASEKDIVKIMVPKPYLLPEKGHFQVTVYTERGTCSGLLMIKPRTVYSEKPDQLELEMTNSRGIVAENTMIGIEFLDIINKYQSQMFEYTLA